MDKPQMIERRFKMVRIDPCYVLDLFRQVPAEFIRFPNVVIPEDAVTCGIWLDIERDCFVVRLASMSFEPIEMGDATPYIVDAIATYTETYSLMRAKGTEESIIDMLKHLVNAYKYDNGADVKLIEKRLERLGVDV